MTQSEPRRADGRKIGASGGTADKLGNRYELALAVQGALWCLQDERRYITFEDLDPELAHGSEFTLEDERGTKTVTQIKRQQSTSDKWTISALQRRGIFDSAARHIDAGRRYLFSSMTPASGLRVLCEWAKQSGSLGDFLAWQLTEQLTPTFDELASPKIFGTPERAWRMLQNMRFETQDEERVLATNAVLAATTLEGAEQSVVPIVIGAILLDNLHVRLGRRELLESLLHYGIEPQNASASRTANEEVKTVTTRWRTSVTRELLSPRIVRDEEAQLRDLLDEFKLTLVVGTAGGGKSSIAEAVASRCAEDGMEVLAFRLDRLGALTSTLALGRDLGLSTSPVVALRMAGGARRSVLIVDQLDAVSLASGRLSDGFDVIAELIREAKSAPDMRVVLVCRLFDVENDHRIRQLVAHKSAGKIAVAPLTEDAVLGAVDALGVDSAALSPLQMSLLKSPLNLVLLQSIAVHGTPLDFTSRRALFDGLWNWKQQIIRVRHPEVRFEETLGIIANTASDRQTLSIPVQAVDYRGHRHDVEVLASEQLITIDGDAVSFFHEAFFDYTFARRWLHRQQSLVEFLSEHEQELFRRAQVRQILDLLRELDVARFRKEVREALSSPRVRLHIKVTVVSVFANVQSPTSADLQLFLGLVAEASAVTPILWRQVTRSSWYGLFRDEGLIREWIDSDEQDDRDRGATWLAAAGSENGAEVAKMLTDRRQYPEFAEWLSLVAQRTELHRNRSIFELVVDSVKDGTLSRESADLWLSVHDLANHEPRWAIKLIRAALQESPLALRPDESGAIPFLKSRDYSLTQMIATASESEPYLFVAEVVPILLGIMSATEMTGMPDRLRLDHHYGFRFPNAHIDGIDDALYEACVKALISVSRTDPSIVRPVLRDLASDVHDAAQALLFRTVTSCPEPFAEWAADLLLEGGSRLQSGYASDGNWISRELLHAVSPIVTESKHRALENLVRNLRNPHEHGRSFGYTAFKFLTALEPRRLTPAGARALAEYRRKFERDEPSPASGITGYTVGSPIGMAAAERMSDGRWLEAITKYDNDDRDGRDPSVGGASELAQVLKHRTVEDPARFSKLALNFPSETHVAYQAAILQGISDASISPEAEPAVFDAVKHIARLDLPEADRWLGWSLRNLLDATPPDIVEILCQRAVGSTDPNPVAGDERTSNGLRQHGINTARGSLAEAIGDLVVHDADGRRTAIVSPYLQHLARDPDLGVRTCVAHTIAACLRHDRSAAYDAFLTLIDTDDVLLASASVRRLMNYIGNVNPEVIDPLIDRMMRSTNPETRQSGGALAAFAATEWNRGPLMQRILNSDSQVRAGAASLCAARVSRTSDSAALIGALRRLSYDKNEEVRKAVGGVASELRDQPLGPLRELLEVLIESPSYTHATPQLLIALQHATDRVDDLVVRAAHSFLDLHEEAVPDMRTAVSADAHFIAELVVRGLAQSTDGKRVGDLLDIVDRLVELGVYGVERAIESADRV